MIFDETGSIFESDQEALVNPVNCSGVMGKGLARQFKELFPEMFSTYYKACQDRELQIGTVQLCKVNLAGRRENHPRWIVNFPTKKHWTDRSHLPAIKSTLKALHKCLEENNIGSVAIPAIGCGLGGLDWRDVYPLIKEFFGPSSEIKAHVYSPA
jgi:O-acetyl-ADP-ribose deacetylase (regulator of RNase III)